MRVKCDWCGGTGGPVPPSDDPCNRCGGSGGVELKVTGATSLLELQKSVRQIGLDIHINFVGSASCYRCVVVGPSKDDATQPKSASGIGRDLAEAIAAALNNYDNHLFQERP